MFKSIVIAFALLAVIRESVTAEISAANRMKIVFQLLESGKECLKDYPLTKEDISIFNEFNLPDNENAQCFTACTFRGVGLMGEKGEYTADPAITNIKKLIDDEEAVDNIAEFIKSCSSVNNDDVDDGEKGCDRAKLVHTCLKKNSEQYGFDFSHSYAA